MALTTKDIIKIIPFDDKFRDELLRDFDGLDSDRKFDIEQAIWDAYDLLYEFKLKENTQLAFLKAENNEENLDGDFYKRIREKTDKEMQELSIDKVEQSSLDEARKAMEIIVREIQAAKKK